MPRSSKLPVLNLLTGQKSGFSPSRGDSYRFRSNLAGTTDTWARFAVQNLTSIGAGGGNAAPKYHKFPLFGKESLRRGEPLDRFLKFLWAFICPTILHQCFKFDVIRFTGHRVIAEKPHVGQFPIRPNFSVHPVGKTVRWFEKWMTPFLVASTSSITVQSLGKIAQRAPAVGAKTWCLYVFCHAPRPARCSFEGCTVRTSIALPFIGRFGRGFWCTT